ncbi:GNAT family N-acetyltransferase [Longimicrobium sp.]|uniref:GNAT family N-acetyltransferase n=1 Tax=Longimicrobium sp. TaxID=2029185 RepID=UPI003B3AB265
MTDATIRIARPDEYPRVLATYEAWGYGGGVTPEDRIYLAERGGELVGIVRRTREHEVTMLRGMQVAAEWRGRGIGAQLLRAFVAELGTEECLCVPYTHLTEFYGSPGFVQMPEEALPPFLRYRLAGYRTRGLSVLVMRRPGSVSVDT